MAKQVQEQRFEQGLSLSPAQIQAIRLLELTGLELESRIERELEENPALEEGREDAQEGGSDDLDHDPDSPSEQDWELGEYASDDDIPAYKLRELQDRNARREEIPFASGAPSLDDMLLEQLRLEGLQEDEEEVARYVVGSITADGYLPRTAEEIQDDLLFKAGIDASLEMISRLIARVRQLDPPGVGARDLQDCLLLQLERRSDLGEQRMLAMQLLRHHYDDFANKRFDRLVERMGLSRSELADLYALIARLNPKPASGYNSTIEEDRMMHYNPDFVVSVVGEELVVSLVGERDIRPLYVSPVYTEMLETADLKGDSRGAREAREFVRHKLDQARWFIDAISQRQDTLRRTMQAIVDYQRAFFLSGELSALRPMILKDIAEATHLDISTISRVSNSKSVQTDYGIYPLKFFFGEGLTTTEGEEVSVRAIKERLSTLIEGEDKRKPYTDDELTHQLSEAGYKLARRTIAKYREQLQIPVARLRREV